MILNDTMLVKEFPNDTMYWLDLGCLVFLRDSITVISIFFLLEIVTLAILKKTA